MGEEEPLASPYFGHHSFLLALGNKEVDEICSLRKWKSGLVSSPARSPIMREGFTMLRDGDTCGTLMGWAPGCGGISYTACSSIALAAATNRSRRSSSSGTVGSVLFIRGSASSRSTDCGAVSAGALPGPSFPGRDDHGD
jgi:hypothetical protein